MLGISGSLRKDSTNSLILQTIQLHQSGMADMEIYSGLDQLPHFNPGITEPDIVKEFKQKLAAADALIISTPEYAFGVPGVLKNALDWLVSSGELNEKPVAAISASPLWSGGDKAMASLLLTLQALGTHTSENTTLSIPLIKTRFNSDMQLTDPEILHQLKNLVKNLLCILNPKT
ncbi:NAD(P)H-dependent FMN reductase [Dyadobacter sp. CECT 9275]|uniref:NAD(P)H-dependent FMN reductase n=2 Tax=Dyadobacter helix TaxID=2822344 RepID=A0A916JEH8_9BACT|nr:NAD(P)H-dependent FMN reductase [Dyadobacter sp. CECT 9275]